MKKLLSLLITLCITTAALPATFANGVEVDTDIPMVDLKELKSEWKKDQDFELADPAPWNLDELKQVVDVEDPRSVAAYYVWAVTRLVDDYDDGMEMMKYLFADLEPYGSGFTEGGMSGKAGWDTYFNERLKSNDYKWLPRAYFDGAEASNGFIPERPLTLELYYNNTNTETINAQSFEQLGRLNIVYWVMSYAAGNKVNITVSKFDGSDRWYVTSGTTPSALFYDQRAGLTSEAKEIIKTAPNDDSTAEEHSAKYGGATEEPAEPEDEPEDEPEKEPEQPKEEPKDEEPKDEEPKEEPKAEKDLPFTDVPAGSYFEDAVAWAFEKNVTTGTTETTFGPFASCTRGQVVTFLWRAAGKPEPSQSNNPFADVSSDAYYYNAVLWAVENGITAGTSENEFSPEQTCSSAHIITFLYRAMGIGSNGWYEEARGWANGAGLLDGTGLSVNPDELCPRGAVVTFLYRIYNK